ncbi:MAG: chromosomal replication initiator protein DnaA [bacterium]|nr:chromosomal replication initiator protein DnaA [bacterium]
MNNNLWPQVLEEIKISVSKPIFQTLFLQTDLLSLDNNVATITCPNLYIRSLIENRYYSLIKNSLDHQTGLNNSLLFTIKLLNTQNREEKNTVETKNTDRGPLFDWQKKEEGSRERTGLNRKYTLDTFVVGNSNNFAHAAALAIIQNPGLSYNPFFIWGGVGVGKTHLMQAIGHAILDKHPEYKVFYCPSETFTNDIVLSIQNKTMAEFKKKYRNIDVLLIDDIQFISGKEYSQEEFFHTFNTLYMAGKQIILTSDRRPEEISKLEERLTSRFMGGLTVDIQSPDFETRVAILKARCKEKGVDIDEQAITFLAQTVTSNIRELEGTLSQILTQCATSGGVRPNLDFVRNFFGVKGKTHTKDISPKTVLAAVSKHFKTKTSEILGNSRRAELVLPRQITMYLLREEIEVPLVKIGEILGGRDHTTIMHGVRKISQRFTSDSSLRHEIMLIKQALYG